MLDKMLTSNAWSTFLIVSISAFILICFLYIGSGIPYYNARIKITEKIFDSIVEEQGYIVGFFGQCYAKKDSKYYMPCLKLLTEQQLADIKSSSFGKERIK